MFELNVATIELYEGNTQANSTVWTSFDAPPLPAIEQQAYIIPATIVSMRETITEKGITNKHVLSTYTFHLHQLRTLHVEIFLIFSIFFLFA